MAIWDNIQGKWSLAGGVWTDASGNGYTLSASASSPTSGTGHDGVANGSAAFASASTQYLYIADASAANLKITGNITISYWVYHTTVTAYQMHVTKWGASGSYSYAIFLDNSGKVNFRLSSNGTAATTCITNKALAATTWYHICCVYDGSTQKIYINGVLDYNSTNNPLSYSSGIYNSSSNFEIGYMVGAAFPMGGLIDDVAIFNASKTQSEVNQLFMLSGSFVENGFLSGTIKNDKNVAIDCSTYNVRVNAYSKNNSSTAPVATTLVTSSDGRWVLSGLTPGTKYLISYEYEGTYGSQTDIATADFKTAL